MVTFKKISLFKPASLAGAIALGFSAMAGTAAAEVVYEPGKVIQTQAFEPVSGSFTIDLSFLRFDSSLGTLTSIIFEASIEGSHSISATNNSNEDGTYTLSSTITIRLHSDGVRLNTTDSIYSTSVYLDPSTSDVLSGSASGSSASTYDATGTRNVGTGANSIVIGDYVGNGSFTIRVSANSVGGGIGPSPNEIVASSSASGVAKVTYVYAEPVPEPGTWAALAMGAGLLIASSRFRRRA